MTSSTHSPLPPVCKHGPAGVFTSALRRLVNNPEFSSDVKFVVGKERQEVFAHRCILACRCEVFHGMFSRQPQTGRHTDLLESPVVLSEVQPEVFLAVIEFLYTNCVTLNNYIALEVLTSAVEYGLDDLRKLCVEFITDTLKVENVCEAMQAFKGIKEGEILKRFSKTWIVDIHGILLSSHYRSSYRLNSVACVSLCVPHRNI